MGGIRRQTELTLMCSISHAGFLTSTRHPSSHSSREVTYPALRTAPLVAALAVVALIPRAVAVASVVTRIPTRCYIANRGRRVAD
jgi:hypothetical protein